MLVHLEARVRGQIMDRESAELSAIRLMSRAEQGKRGLVFGQLARAEAHFRSELVREAMRTFPLWNLPRPNKLSSAEPCPPKSRPAPAPARRSSWIERHSHIAVPQLHALEAAESQTRAGLVAEEAAESDVWRSAIRVQGIEIVSSLRRKQHESRLAMWSEQREARHRLAASIKLYTARAHDMLISESETRRSLLTAEGIAFRGIAAVALDSSFEARKREIYRSATHVSQKLVTQYTKHVLCPALVSLEEAVRRDLWSFDRITVDMDMMIRPALADLRRKRTEFNRTRDAALRIQRFFRRVRAGFVGWRVSHRRAGEEVQARRQQRHMNALRLHTAAVLFSIKESLHRAVTAEHLSQRRGLDAVEDAETKQRAAILSDERWWILCSLEDVRSRVASIFVPLERKLLKDELTHRAALLELYNDHRDRLVVLSRELCERHLRLRLEGDETSQRSELVKVETSIRDEMAINHEQAVAQLKRDWLQARDRHVQTSIAGIVREQADDRVLLTTEHADRVAVAHAFARTMAFLRALSNCREYGHHLLHLFVELVRSDFSVLSLNTHAAFRRRGLLHVHQMTSQFRLHMECLAEKHTRKWCECSEQVARGDVLSTFHTALAAVNLTDATRKNAATVIQATFRGWRTGDVGHQGLIKFLGAKFAYKKEKQRARQERDRVRNCATRAREALDLAVADHNDAVDKSTKRQLLQLEREERWSRTALTEKEAFVYRITRRNLADCICDILVGRSLDCQQTEWLSRRETIRHEALAWDQLVKEIRQAVIGVRIRPGQRQIRRFLGRQKRRRTAAEMFENLPLHERSTRWRIVNEYYEELWRLTNHQVLNRWQAGYDRIVSESFMAREAIARRDVQQIQLESATHLLLRSHSAGLNAIMRDESRDFEFVSGPARHASLARVDVSMLETASRVSIEDIERRLRIEACVVPQERLHRLELESIILSRSLPRARIEAEEATARTVVQDAAVTTRITSILLEDEQFHRHLMLNSERNQRLLMSCHHMEGRDRTQCVDECRSALSDLLWEARLSLFSTTAAKEKRRRDGLRIEAAEHANRFDLEREWIRAQSTALETHEAFCRQHSDASRCSVDFFAILELIHAAVHEKAAMMASRLCDNERIDAMCFQENLHRTWLLASRKHELESLIDSANGNALTANRAEEARRRAEISDEEKRWRNRLLAANEHRVAHAAATTIQAAWDRRQRRVIPGYVSSRQAAHLTQHAEAMTAEYASLAAVGYADLCTDIMQSAARERISIHEAAQREVLRTQQMVDTESIHERVRVSKLRALGAIEDAESDARALALENEIALRLVGFSHQVDVSARWMGDRLIKGHAARLLDLGSRAETEARARIEREWFAAVRLLERSSDFAILTVFQLRMEEENRRSDIEKVATEWFARLARARITQHHAREKLEVDEDANRLAVELLETNCRSDLLCEIDLGYLEARRRHRHCAAIRLQRWWRRRSLVATDNTLVTAAVYLRDALAATFDAATQFRNFTEDARHSAIRIQAIWRGFQLRRRLALSGASSATPCTAQRPS